MGMFLIALVFFNIFMPVCLCEKLLIAIFSAPNNFQQRYAARRTWLKLAENNLDVKYLFVIGNEMCAIAPENRKSLYGCEELYYFAGSNIPSMAFKSNSNNFEIYLGFSFVAQREITITHLSISFCMLRQLEEPVRIRILDASDSKTLISVTIFSEHDSNSKAIRPITFPRGAEGVVIIEFNNKKDELLCGCSSESFTEHDSILMTGLFKNNQLERYNKRHRLCAYFLFKTDGPQHISRNQRLWESERANIFENIEIEKVKCNDLVVVNSTEFYRNLPNKLLEFFKFIIDTEKFDYLLKTDDDSFIDIPRVLSHLMEVKTDHLWIWSSMRKNLEVPLLGKWREEKYHSVTYPPFPCGGGYVLNQKTVAFLSSISAYLKTFQGEDVSIGIWLAATNIEYYTPIKGNMMMTFTGIMRGYCERACDWVCNNTFRSLPCNLVQLNTSEIFSTWENYQKIGHIGII